MSDYTPPLALFLHSEAVKNRGTVTLCKRVEEDDVTKRDIIDKTSYLIQVSGFKYKTNTPYFP